MFGYFRFLSQYSDYRSQGVYKNYYCGLCIALELHYGQLSRMLLSYDVTVLALALHAHKTPECERLKCLGCKDCKKELFRDETWKKLAAVNILLAAEKLRDDKEDEASWKAKAGLWFFGSVIGKAKSDYPDLDRVIHEGYRKIQGLEKENKSVLEIADSFGQLMSGIVTTGFDAPTVMVSYVYEIARWLYFVDALDDYDEDLEKGRFNPIAKKDLPFRDYVNTHTRELRGLIRNLWEKHGELLKALEDGSIENDILKGILTNSIPAVTSMVLNGRQIPTLLHFKSGTVWREKT